MGMPVDLLAAAVAPRSGWAHDLRARLQSVSGSENFRGCGRPWAREVRVVMAPTGETRRLGMHLCASCWVCPVCWSRRRQTERAEIGHAAGLWCAAGAGLAATVVTVPHRAGEPLEAVWGRLDGDAAQLRSGAARKAFARYGVAAVTRVNEVSWGPNGWHPHQHLLWWLEAPWDGPTEAGVIEWWRTWRRRHWEKKRHSPLYKPEHDPFLPDVHQIEPADIDATAGHLTKGPSRNTIDRYWKAKAEGNEDLAAYLAPFAIGEQAADGDAEAMALWREYETATAGRHWIRWPDGWRERFGVGPGGRFPALDGDIVARFPASVGPVQGRDCAPRGVG